jgi:hypothetical protein
MGHQIAMWGAQLDLAVNRLAERRRDTMQQQQHPRASAQLTSASPRPDQDVL